MGDPYFLTIQNNSGQPRLTFAVFAKLDIGTEPVASDPFCAAWIVRRIDDGNSYDFKWQLDYSVVFDTKGCDSGVTWEGHGGLPMDPKDSKKSLANFAYDGDYNFAYGFNDKPSDYNLYVVDDPDIPPFNEQPVSVGLSIALHDGASGAFVPEPAVATDGGPNLKHTFILHPTYYVAAGTFVKGQMADVSTVTSYYKIEYTDGVNDIIVTLDNENQWSQKPQVPSATRR
ncbi:hypothetical protein B4N89_31350 [Embleya scabrispora]|uniref:Uncharacterized protein n=1 Tax=Embleya scabrispora TaxID=159449 RepID=A0A1T3NP57_9ACTN|nr:hypothetical protein [Embleya scabrispora]OPC78667.1 hypothetical protein B4N89_31350 [Embleya scabrispora]